ncbi:MAG: hypothetical protein H0U60_02970 [Blastocatellia bacterium]|nr:hypothetical protein [Blastocatellia bacterium]
MLAVSARGGGKEVLLLDARRVEHIKDEADLRRFFSLTERVNKEIGRSNVSYADESLRSRLDT